MQYGAKDHTFVICAYKESVFLEACVQSLKNQTVQTNILLVTSTPNEHIEQMVKQYDLTYYINEGETGITQDWNFALQCADTPLVTIAHQDDVYESAYAEQLLKEVSQAKKPLIFFSDYGELRNDERVDKNKLLKIKRFLLKPLEIRALQKSIFVRRRILSLGSPIACPAVTYVKPNLKLPVFTAGFRSDEDWEAWERISRFKGTFVYCKKILMYHRIHEESETSIILNDSARSQEDFAMFCKFWPKPIARIIAKVYATSEQSNELENI